MLLSVSGGQSMFEFGSLFSRAQLFEGRLALNPGFLFLFSKAFSLFNLRATTALLSCLDFFPTSAR